MDVIIVQAAEEELVGAVASCNRQSEGLGYEFAAEVNRTIGDRPDGNSGAAYEWPKPSFPRTILEEWRCCDERRWSGYDLGIVQ